MSHHLKEPREIVVNADRTVWVTVTRKLLKVSDSSPGNRPQTLVPRRMQRCFAGSTASVVLRVTGCMGEKVVGAEEKGTRNFVAPTWTGGNERRPFRD